MEEEERDSARRTAPATPRSVADERRRHQRRRLEVAIGVHGDSNFYAGFSEDVSEGGVFISASDLLPIGSLVEVEFTLPGGHPIRCGGEVRWLKEPVDDESKPGMGVQFADLPMDDLKAIQEFVASRKPIFHV